MMSKMRSAVLLSCFALGNAQMYMPNLYKGAPKLEEVVNTGIKEKQPTLTVQEPGLCDTTVKSYSGYFDTSPDPPGDSRKLFYWFFESRNDPKKDPVILWLTGGPGCSSMLATLAENGPCKIGKDGKPELRDHSWNSNASVVWVDQPAGTGFSVGNNSGHMYESIVADQMYGFLQAFFKHFTRFWTNDFFVTGESYGGHYVPSVAHRVWQGNREGGGIMINLQGLAIGNGMTDPEEQFKWFPEMALDGGKKYGGTAPGVYKDSDAPFKVMNSSVDPCVERISMCKTEQTYDACADAMGFCSENVIGQYSQSGMNTYDQRIKCAVPPLCYDFSAETKWLNSAEVQKALGVSKAWESCNDAVNGQFMGDWMMRYDWTLPKMMEDNIRVLIYAGDCDFICNWLGNKHWTLKLDWPHRHAFNKAADDDYMVNGKAAGRVRQVKNFAFMQVFQAGHMVPLDQPDASLQMINDFIFNKLSAHAQPHHDGWLPHGLSTGAVAVIIIVSILFLASVAFIAVKRPCCKQARQGRSVSVDGTALSSDVGGRA